MGVWQRGIPPALGLAPRGRLGLPHFFPERKWERGGGQDVRITYWNEKDGIFFVDSSLQLHYRPAPAPPPFAPFPRPFQARRLAARKITFPQPPPASREALSALLAEETHSLSCLLASLGSPSWIWQSAWAFPVRVRPPRRPCQPASLSPLLPAPTLGRPGATPNEGAGRGAPCVASKAQPSLNSIRGVVCGLGFEGTIHKPESCY